MESPRAPRREASGLHTVAHTDRLRLDGVVPDDLDEHFRLRSDSAVWAHSPEGRHTSPERTTQAIAYADGPDAGNPDPSAVRLVYADRPLPDALLARITAHP